MNFEFRRNSLVGAEALGKTAQSLGPYFEHLQQVVSTGVFDTWESSINLPSDERLLNNVLAVKRRLVGKGLRYVIVIGIGGSNLGTKAIYDARFGFFDRLQPMRFPKLIFLDTCDPEFLSQIQNFLKTETKKLAEVLINLISKSGSTTESVYNAEVVLNILRRRFPKSRERIVVTTDEGSKLWQLAQQKNFTTLAIPEKVGGRYSVLSTVGLFPLAAVGLNIKALREGALAMRERCLRDGLKNPALVSASVLSLRHQQGSVIHDTFVFHPELESLGKWYRQLMGESIGKEKDASGAVVNAGIFPSVSVGSTDLHSVGQLYLGGPKNVITTFISARRSAPVRIAKRLDLTGLVDGIAGRSAGEVMDAIREGVKIAYAKRGLPFLEVVLDDLSERSLGEFLQFKMIEMMLLAKFMHVNAFDQPNVESYKTETRKILSR